MRKELNGILVFVGIIWAVFLLDFVMPWWSFTDFGIMPRTVSGLIGIFTAPVLHNSFSHIVSNTVPLVVLLVLLFSFHSHPIRAVICLTVMSGVLLWLFGRNRIHVGASGLIYSIIAYLIITGILERKVTSMAIAAVVGLLYGGTLFWGVLPQVDATVSWDGHFLGAVAGGLYSWGTVKRKPWRSRTRPGDASNAVPPEADLPEAAPETRPESGVHVPTV